MEKPIVIFIKSRGGGYAEAMKNLEEKLKKLTLSMNSDEEREKRMQAHRNVILTLAKAINPMLSKEDLKKELDSFGGVNIDFVVVDEYNNIFKDCSESIQETSDLVEELGSRKREPTLHGFKTENYVYEDCATLSPKEFGMKKRGVRNFNNRRR